MQIVIAAKFAEQFTGEILVIDHTNIYCLIELMCVSDYTSWKVAKHMHTVM